MTDPRVWRGNTYTLYRNLKQEQKRLSDMEREKRTIKARPTYDNAYHRRMRAAREAAVFDTVPPVAGRSHVPVQTELFLQEVLAKIPEAEKANQTDEFLERPPSPVFVPAKTGVDNDTQILDGELFLFDVEVKPIIEVVNGKVIEQALLEVLQEEELADIRMQQNMYQAIRNFEKAEQQRLVDEARRRREEKEMRKRERIIVMKKEQEVSEKLAAHAFAKTYLEALIPNVFSRLREDGLFVNPARAELDIHFVPWLIRKVSHSLDEAQAVNLLIQDLVKEAIQENRTEIDNIWHSMIEEMNTQSEPVNVEQPEMAAEPAFEGPIPIPQIQIPEEED
ncbi:radial spoke head protein 3 homolog [Paramacrobiotus metropolitanus]|uniref:radial spoke head protein 3 homolog n=1 Tax=Paramacrobiotus metropolitanus TaxID=2943436 RepID=UPI0024462410|nr:radial spoke head protein 3 homolog [Paramacrobiotus metropolitanus]